MNVIFPYIGNNDPNWRTHIFQRGRLNHQPVMYGQFCPQDIGGTREVLKSSSRLFEQHLMNPGVSENSVYPGPMVLKIFEFEFSIVFPYCNEFQVLF